MWLAAQRLAFVSALLEASSECGYRYEAAKGIGSSAALCVE